MSKKATKKPAKKSKKKSGGGLEAAIAKYRKSSGFSKEKLRKVAKRGMGAYYSSFSSCHWPFSFCPSFSFSFFRDPSFYLL